MEINASNCSLSIPKTHEKKTGAKTTERKLKLV